MVNKKQDRIAMLKTRFFLVSHILILFLMMSDSEYCCVTSDVRNEGSAKVVQYPWKVPIGVVLDLNSALGTMTDLCMKMAISDFYSANQNYKTRLQLNTKNADSVLGAHFAGTFNSLFL